MLGCLVLVGMNACEKPSDFQDFDVSALAEFEKPYCILQIEDSAFAVGGSDANGGLIQWFYLNDAVRVKLEHFPATVQQLTKFKDSYVAALDGHRLFTTSVDGSFSEHFFQPKDWVSTEFKSEFRQFLNVGDSALLAVSGSKLAFGTLIQSYDSLETWAPLQLENELRCLAQNGNKLFAAGNGILIHTTIGDTNWNRIDLKNTAIAGLHFLDESNAVAVTYRGQILESSDGGFIWSKPKGGKAAYVNKSFKADDIIYILGNDGLLGTFQTGEITWKQLELSYDLKDGIVMKNHLYLITEQANLITIALSALAE